MVSKKSFKLLVVSRTTSFFAFVQIIYFLDCGNIKSDQFPIFVLSTYPPKINYLARTINEKLLANFKIELSI